MTNPKVGEYYQHYSGNIYRIVPIPAGVIYLLPENTNFIWYQNIKTSEVYNLSPEDFAEPKIVNDKTVQRFIKIENGTGHISDGYHTFNELYEHRNLLFLLFLDWCDPEDTKPWRAPKHYDGTFYDNWFIVGCELKGKQVTYHLPIAFWDLCNFLPTHDAAPHPWDGHTSEDVIERLRSYFSYSNNKPSVWH